MRSRINFKTLLLSLLLGAAPLAAWAQLNEALNDPAFVRAHRLRSATSYEYVQGRLRYVVTRRYARSGRQLSPPPAAPPRRTPESRWREEQVCDAQDRVAAVKYYRGDTLQWVEHRVYGPNRWPLQSYRYYPARPGKPAAYVLNPTSRYDYRGNPIETLYNEAGMVGGWLRFGIRYRCSYDAHNRLTSVTEYEELYSPRRTDSTYRDANGRVLRQAAYYHNHYAGWPMCETLTLYQYNARGQQTSRISIGYEGQFQDVTTQTYRLDGQPLQVVYYRAGSLPHPVPWTEAVRRTAGTFSQAENFERSQTDYRYNQRGLLTDTFEHWRRSPQYGEAGLDQKTRYRWRYTYYP